MYNTRHSVHHTSGYRQQIRSISIIKQYANFSSSSGEFGSTEVESKDVVLRDPKQRARLQNGGGSTLVNGASVRRRHSRASSVDRRDMFHKYVQGAAGEELSENIKPFDSGLGSELLLHQQQQNSTQNKGKSVLFYVIHDYN